METRSIKVKTEGLTKEENAEIKDFIRKLRRKSKAKEGKVFSYKMKLGKKLCVTR